MNDLKADFNPSYAYADYDISPDPDHRPLYLNGVLQALKHLKPKAAVLDAGCGGGLFSVGLEGHGYSVFGLDLSPSAIAAAQSRGIGEFKVASLYEDLCKPFNRSGYDAIVAIEVIEHLYSPARFAEMTYKALEPGGLIVISTPYWGWLKNIVLAISNRIDRALTALWEGGHIKHFSRKTLVELMTRQGFEVVSFQGCGEGWRAHAPWLWSGMLMAFRKPELKISEHEVNANPL